MLKDMWVKGKDTKVRNGIEDMNETDRMIMVKLGHESKMRGFSEGERKAGGDCDHNQG